ncbi:MAG TPA: hypothetical protein VFD82_08195 [Planctomycetota bacterium]|nr:hypothetical protein [Planctomycetota bacterium]
MDGSRGVLADARAVGTIPVSGPGRFKAILLIERVVVDTNYNGPVLPREIEVRGADDAVVVLDIEPKVVAKVLEQLSRNR